MNGADATGVDSGGGSGGTIDIEIDDLLEGHGTISADGGKGKGQGGGGAGGRIKIKVKT